MAFDRERLEAYQVALDLFDLADLVVEQLRHRGSPSTKRVSKARSTSSEMSAT
jgi:hypothetical protein